MKVYELMNKLAQMPAGAKVRITMVKSLKELPKEDMDLRLIDFTVQEVNYIAEDTVTIDGWDN